MQADHEKRQGKDLVLQLHKTCFKGTAEKEQSLLRNKRYISPMVIMIRNI